MEKTPESWIRDPNFKKYFGTVFGITKAGDGYRLDIGNEKIKISDKDYANVSECQIILPKKSFETLLGLMERVQKDEKKAKRTKKKSK